MTGGFLFSQTGVQGRAPDVRFIAFHAVRECYIIVCDSPDVLSAFVGLYAIVILTKSMSLYYPGGFGGFPPKRYSLYVAIPVRCFS